MKFNPFKFFQKKPTEKKENPAGAYLMIQGQSSFKAMNSRARVTDGYAQNVIVFSAIQRICKAMSGIDIDVMEDGEYLEDHPFDKILTRPNPMQTWAKFLSNVMTEYLIHGEMFISRITVNGEVQELWSLSPVDMTVKEGRGGIPSKYIYGQGAGKKEFDVDPVTGVSDIFHFKMHNPLDYWRGLSPLSAAGLAVDLHNEGLLWNYSLLKNSACPSGIFSFQSDVTQEAVSRLRELNKKNLQGSRNAGEMVVLTNGADFKEMSHSPADMDYLNTMKEAAKYISLVYGVPIPLIDNDASTFNNIDIAKEMLYTDTVLPLLDEFLEAFGSWALGDDEGLELVYDADSIDALEGLRARRDDRMSKRVGAGIVSIDEAREALDYAPIGGIAAEPMVSSSMVPIADVGMIPDVMPEDQPLAKTMRQAGIETPFIKEILKK